MSNWGSRPLALFALLALLCTLTACGGGSGGVTTYGNPPGPTSTPSATSSPSSAPAQQAAVLGSPAWVTPQGMTLYTLSSDTMTGGACTGGCLNIWPIFAAPSGASAQAGFTPAVRSDGAGTQWTYNGLPLYRYAGDSRPGDAQGEGLTLGSGVWHVARPAAVGASSPTPTPSPVSSQPPCSGYSC